MLKVLTDFVDSCVDDEWLTWNCKPKSIISDFIFAWIPLIAAFFESVRFFGWLKPGIQLTLFFQLEVKVGNDLWFLVEPGGAQIHLISWILIQLTYEI